MSLMIWPLSGPMLMVQQANEVSISMLLLMIEMLSFVMTTAPYEVVARSCSFGGIGPLGSLFSVVHLCFDAQLLAPCGNCSGDTD